MKLSDKALRLIGLTVLARTDSSNDQNDSEIPANYPHTAGYGRPRLPLEARFKAVKAPVLPFRNKDPEG